MSTLEIAPAEDVREEDRDPRLSLVERITADPLFSRATKLREFLRYVVDQNLRERRDRISEQEIGVNVFGRRPDYNPNEDNIARSYARLLRKRLDDYYGSSGREEALLLSMPKGSYEISFEPRIPTVGPTSSETPQESPDRRVTTSPMAMLSRSLVVKIGALLFLFTVLACCASFFLGRMSESQAAEARLSGPVNQFWSRVLGRQPTEIVSSDTGLSVVLGITQQDVTVQQYIDGDYLKPLHNRFPNLVHWDRRLAHRYSSYAALNEVARLLAIPAFSRDGQILRFARDISANDLQTGNVVLIGGSNADPWVKLFDQDLNFSLSFQPVQRSFRILDKDPKRDEKAEYPYTPWPSSEIAYGLVAILPRPQKAGVVVLFEGTTDSGMEAAANFFQDPKHCAQLEPLIFDKNGHIHLFQALVRTQSVGGNAMTSDLLGYRIQ